MPDNEDANYPTAFEIAVGILSGRVDLMPEEHKLGMRKIALELSGTPIERLNGTGEGADAGVSIEYDPI